MAPRDALDLRAVRGGGRREIPWDAEDRAPLDPERRRVVGGAWFSRMEQEHLAVGAFSRLSLELAELGCDSVVLALLTRAAADEVRHADICRRLAARHLGAAVVPARLSGIPTLTERIDAEGRPLGPEDRALLRVVEMCCLSETFTGVYFTEMLERTTEPTARAAVESLLEDEIDHGRVGWAYLASQRREGRGAILTEALPSLLVETVKPVFDEADVYPEADDPAKEAHAWLGRGAAREIYRRALAEIILPGFEALELDVRPARALAAREGWICAAPPLEGPANGARRAQGSAKQR